MEKALFEDFKKQAYEEGENDTVTEDKLLEGFELWADCLPAEGTTEEEHNELLEAYRLGFFGQRLPVSVMQSLESISDQTSWDNWEVDEIEGERNSESTGKHWKVCEVLHCKLEHVRELIDELDTLPGYDEDSHSEHRDTLDQVQELLNAIKKYEPSEF